MTLGRGGFFDPINPDINLTGTTGTLPNINPNGGTFFGGSGALPTAEQSFNPQTMDSVDFGGPQSGFTQPADSFSHLNLPSGVNVPNFFDTTNAPGAANSTLSQAETSNTLSSSDGGVTQLAPPGSNFNTDPSLQGLTDPTTGEAAMQLPDVSTEATPPSGDTSGSGSATSGSGGTTTSGSATTSGSNLAGANVPGTAGNLLNQLSGSAQGASFWDWLKNIISDFAARAGIALLAIILIAIAVWAFVKEKNINIDLSGGK